jgi:hypothetical protein
MSVGILPQTIRRVLESFSNVQELAYTNKKCATFVMRREKRNRGSIVGSFGLVYLTVSACNGRDLPGNLSPDRPAPKGLT